MLREIVGICDHRMNRTDTLCGKVQSFMMLQKVVYTLTTQFFFLIFKALPAFQRIKQVFLKPIKSPRINYWLSYSAVTCRLVISC